MSKVVIQGHASGTGDFTIAAPNSNTDRTLTLPDASGTLDRLDRAGNVLQVIQSVKTDTQTILASTSFDFQEITDLSVTLTPSSTSSKILLIATVNGSIDTRYGGFAFYRGTTKLTVGDASGSRTPVAFTTGGNSSRSNEQYVMNPASGSLLDSPSTTNSTTYYLKGAAFYTGNILYINRTDVDVSANYTVRGISTLTAMEISG
jgi:hypothetical protein